MAGLDPTAVIVAGIGGIVSVATIWIPLRWGKKAGQKATIQSPPETDHAPPAPVIDVIDSVRKMRLEMHDRFDRVDDHLRRE